MKLTSVPVIISFIFATLATFLVPGGSSAHAAPYGMPSVIDTSAKYLVFLHNYYVETKGTDGDCKYYDILKTFSDRGFIVISEVRQKDVSVVEYSKKAAADIDKLLTAGVPEENITVTGHSKGAVIAMRIASILGKPKVNYVVMAGCGIKMLEKGYPDSASLKGKILSIHVTSDKIAGSCISAFSGAKEGFVGREITLESQAGHQLFFKPEALWIEPVIGWLKGN